MTDWLQTASPASAARPAGDKRRLALDGEAYTFEESATYYAGRVVQTWIRRCIYISILMEEYGLGALSVPADPYSGTRVF